MKTNKSLNEVQESTYSLLVRSEEKGRTLFEAVAYGLLIMSAVAAIWQFAQQPVNLPVGALPRSASVVQVEIVSRS